MGNLLGFNEAVDDSKGKGERNLLMGNGFSMAWDADTFGYKKLLDEADLSSLLVDKKTLFKQLETSDFEQAMAALDAAARIADLYAYTDLTAELDLDAVTIKEGLAQVLSKVHPTRSSEVADSQLKSVREFLLHFDTFFTLNYDLLLYWALNADRTPLVEEFPRRDDGFRNAGSGLVWDEFRSQQVVFNLHGAFHLYTGVDGDTHKLRYITNNPLIVQVRDAIGRREYPIVVTEGRWEQKLRSINLNPYLRYCLRRLQSANGSLFMFGVAMSGNDQHIFKHLESPTSKLSRLYVGVRGKLGDSHNASMVDRARLLATRRQENHGKKLTVQFYAAETAHVWG